MRALAVAGLLLVGACAHRASAPASSQRYAWACDARTSACTVVVATCRPGATCGEELGWCYQFDDVSVDHCSGCKWGPSFACFRDRAACEQGRPNARFPIVVQSPCARYRLTAPAPTRL
jgi:hypothetical protein